MVYRARLGYDDNDLSKVMHSINPRACWRAPSRAKGEGRPYGHRGSMAFSSMGGRCPKGG